MISDKISSAPRIVTSEDKYRAWTPTSHIKSDKGSENRDAGKRQLCTWFQNHRCCCCSFVGLIVVLSIAALITGLVLGLRKSDTNTNAAAVTINMNTTTSTSTTSTSATTTTSVTTSTTSATTTTTTATTSTTSATTSTTSATTSTTSATTSTTSATTSTTSATTSTTSATTSTTSATTSTTSATTSTTSATTSTTSATTSTTSATTSTTSATSTTTTETTSTSATTSTTTTTKPGVSSTIVTFDDIPSQSSSSGVVPNGYNGLTWTNVNYLNGSSMPTSGFLKFLPASPYVAYNPGGINFTIASANGSSFSFDRITWISAWRDNLTVSIALYRSGALRLSNSRVLNPINSTTFSCGICTNIDTISFATSIGFPVSGWSQNGTELAFDNLGISFGY
ncbi:hypothetical protein I4U23_004882 [Adineta vaga]|nr:hypothetical protein I4U23_004882 [Adineta vaga]